LSGPYALERGEGEGQELLDHIDDDDDVISLDVTEVSVITN
jgi:hypothetical protein